MQHLKSFDDLYFDSRDFWSVVNNLLRLNIIPGSKEEKEMLTQQNYLLQWIGDAVERLWPQIEVEFKDKQCTIKFKKEAVVVDLNKRCLQFDKGKIYMPMAKLKFLYDWIYTTTERQLTVPGVTIMKQ